VFVEAGAVELAALTGVDGVPGLPVDPAVPVDPGVAAAALAAAVTGGCDLVIALGGGLETAVDDVAGRAGSETAAFVLVDGARDPGERRPAATEAPAPGASNVRVLDVRLDQAAFLAGVLAATASTSRTVAVVVPPAPSPAVAALAASFEVGVAYRDGLSGIGTTVSRSADPPADVALVLDGRPVEAVARPGLLGIAGDGGACARAPASCASVLSGLVADVGPALQDAADAAALDRFTGGTVDVSVAGALVRLAPVPEVHGLPAADLFQVAAAALAISRGEVRVSPRDLPAPG
jgi:basic membrane lipoprotein Med (substrate-binding protein (PBP1-ABC) superfamily)